MPTANAHWGVDWEKMAKETILKEKINMSYDYWREHIMDERLEYLDPDEKYEMYLHWKNSHADKEYT